MNCLFFEEYLNNLSKFVYKYLKEDLLIIDEPNKLNTPDDIVITNFNKDVIDELYQNKSYDEACLLINFVIKIDYIQMLPIFTNFSLIDKVNFQAERIKIITNFNKF